MLVRAILAVALFAYAHETQASELEVANPCRGDAFRPCLSEMPDRERITACETVPNTPKRSPIMATVSK